MVEVKELLDEAATLALGDRAIDASEVIQRARNAEHRAAVRRSAVAVAAVIVVLIGLVLVPRMTLRAAPQPAAPTLPTSLTLPPLDTPTLSQAPIRAASLVLSVHAGWRRPPTLNGYVAVSAADGSYRRLDAIPSSVHDIKLSDNGRFLAWGEPFTGNFATERAVMHVLRLSDGVERQFALPYHGKFSTVQDFLWSPDGSRLY